ESPPPSEAAVPAPSSAGSSEVASPPPPSDCEAPSPSWEVPEPSAGGAVPVPSSEVLPHPATRATVSAPRAVARAARRAERIGGAMASPPSRQRAVVLDRGLQRVPDVPRPERRSRPGEKLRTLSSPAHPHRPGGSERGLGPLPGPHGGHTVTVSTHG